MYYLILKNQGASTKLAVHRKATLLLLNETENITCTESLCLESGPSFPASFQEPLLGKSVVNSEKQDLYNWGIWWEYRQTGYWNRMKGKDYSVFFTFKLTVAYLKLPGIGKRKIFL